MICPVDEKGYCSRHQEIHFGHGRRLATEDSRHAEQVRAQWDRRKGLTPKGPGLIRKVANRVRASVRFARNRGFILPLELAQERHQVCQTNQCSQYDAQLDRCQHRTCGCSLKEKTTWSTERCPEGLWLPVFGPAPPKELSESTQKKASNGTIKRQLV